MKTGTLYTLLALTKVAHYRKGTAQPLQSLSMSTHVYSKSSKLSKAYKTFTATKSNKQFNTLRSSCVDQTVPEFVIDDSLELVMFYFMTVQVLQTSVDLIVIL